MFKRWVLVLLVSTFTVLAGCGGGGNAPMGSTTSSSGSSNSGSSSGSSNNSSGPFTISPASARIVMGSTQQFTASNGGVTWAVNGTVGGNSTYGTISTSGVYSPPAVAPLNPEVKINAWNSSYAMSIPIAIGTLGANRFAYVSSASDDSIQIFSADGTAGSLQPVSVFSVGTGKGPAVLALSPDAHFLFSLNRVSNDVSVYAINPATGALSPAGSVAVPNGPYGMVFTPKGDFAYVSCENASKVAAFAFNLSTGALTPLGSGSYSAGGGRVQSLAITPDGKFLYAVNRDANSIISLAVAADGSLHPIPGSAVVPPPGLSSIMIWNPDGNPYLYAAVDNAVQWFSIDSSTGMLMPQAVVSHSGAGKSPELLRNGSNDVLIGLNPQTGGAFAYYFYNWDVIGLTSYSNTVGTGLSPIAGGWMYGNAGTSDWVLILNRQADSTSSTGSITIYQTDYSYALIGPKITVPTALHDPTGFVITP